MEFNKIKLVIWDLDNTFWSGVISECEIQPVDKHCELVANLTDCGIVNSICSKNTFDVCAAKLEELGVFHYFVFQSIEWTPKGQRIRALIKSMSLRPENVLFIDDEVTNLEEAKHYSPELMVAGPQIIDDLCAFVSKLEKKDPGHTRLEQYVLLQEKNIEQKKYSSNEEFLYASNIQVEVSRDCVGEVERLHELILRSNQLNYTKKRISKEELLDLLKDEDVESGYVSVRDKFGEYGIVGFFSVIDGSLEHFVFSCRTIGQGIEQHVYACLNYPQLKIQGDVVSMVTRAASPPWINQGVSAERDISPSATAASAIDHLRILVKGPCDLSQSMSYIKHNDSISCEFTYVAHGKGNIVEAYNHSVHILGLKEYSEEQKQEIAKDCMFVDPVMLDGTFFSEEYSVIVLSTLIESNYGIYQKRNSKIQVAFGQDAYPLTDRANWPDYVSGAIYTGNNVFTEEWLARFSAEYEFVGRTKPADYIERIRRMLDYLGKQTILCLILGVEMEYLKNADPAYQDRHLSHAKLNQSVRALAAECRQLRVIDINCFVKDQSDFLDNINHFTPRVYYEIAQALRSIVDQTLHVRVENRSAVTMYVDTAIAKLRMMAKMLIANNESRAYRFLKSMYLRIKREEAVHPVNRTVK